MTDPLKDFMVLGRDKEIFNNANSMLVNMLASTTSKFMLTSLRANERLNSAHRRQYIKCSIESLCLVYFWRGSRYS